MLPLLLARHPIGLVEQSLLPLDHLLQLAHHLLALAHLAGLRDLQVLEQLLQLRQHLLRRLARAGADHVAHRVEHLLQVLPLDLHRVGIDRLHLLAVLRHLLRLTRQGIEILVDRPLQLGHQPLQLLVAGALGERVAQRLLQLAQLALRQRQAAVLEMQRGVPEQRHDVGERGVLLLEQQAQRRRAQRQKHRDVVLIQRGRAVDAVQRRRDLVRLVRAVRQADDAAR